MASHIALCLDRKRLLVADIRTNRRASPRLIQSWSVDVSKGFPETPQAFAEMMAEVWRTNRLTSRTVVWVIPRPFAYIKSLSVKDVPPGLVASHLERSIDQLIPFPLDDAVWDWHAQQGRVMLAAVRQAPLFVAMEGFARARLRLLRVELSTASLVRQLYREWDATEPDTTVGIHTSGGIEVVIVQRGQVAVSRANAYAMTVDEMVKECTKTLQVFASEYQEASRPKEYVVSGPRASEVAQVLERTYTGIRTAIGLHSDAAHLLAVPFAPFAKKSKVLNLLGAAQARRADIQQGGSLSRPPRWKALLTRAAWVAMVGAAVALPWVVSREEARLAELEGEHRAMTAMLVKEQERPWFELIRACQQALPSRAKVKIDTFAVSMEGEVTIEFTSEDFRGIQHFYNFLSRHAFLSHPRLGQIRTMTSAGGAGQLRRWFRSSLKAQLGERPTHRGKM